MDCINNNKFLRNFFILLAVIEPGIITANVEVVQYSCLVDYHDHGRPYYCISYYFSFS